MFHFTRKRIEAHICICFVALKVYKELERMLKVSEIKMSVDKVLALAKTITTIQIKLPLNKEVYTQTMLMARHQKIAKLFDEDFWGTQWRSQEAGYNDYIAESEEHLEEGIRKGNITEADADAIRELKKTTAEQKLANLPEQMIQNIAKGRLAKFFKDNCLVDQEFQFGDGDKQTVGEYLKKVNADLKIVAYKRFTLAAE